MQQLPHDWLALVALALALGVKHGLDADHLVAIDGLTRFNVQAGRKLARWCGVFFSAGHGAVVVGVALFVGLAAERWMVPGWLEDLGAWVSIAFLTALGLLNLAAVVRTPPDHMVQPVAIRGRLLGPILRTSNPLAIALVGALFALSFDTMSQAALFAIAANQVGAWDHGVALALAFLLGMVLADGANGAWIASLLGKADGRARIASRVMGIAVGGLSLLVAGLGALKYFSASFDAWLEGRELGFGLVVIAVVAISFLAALGAARRGVPAANAPARGVGR